MPPSYDQPVRAASGERGAPTSMYCPACAASFSSAVDTCPHDGTRLIHWDPLLDPLVGEVLDGRYRVLDCIAIGDTSLLYRGLQLAVDRQVAIKVLRLREEPVITRRFLREAQILKKLNHPNIVSIFDFGHTSAGELYFILELLRGKTLDAELSRIGRFDVHRSCEVGIQLCHALGAAHARGIVHRDLNPANIMLLDNATMLDHVKVLDFGLARPGDLDGDDAVLTLAGSIIGTPSYIAPEAMFSRGTVDPRSDLYSLGCVLRDLLAGRPQARYNISTPRGQPPPLPADVPRPVADMVNALLAEAPEDRPDSRTVAERLRAWLEDERARIAAAEAETLVAEPVLSNAQHPTLVAFAPAPTTYAQADTPHRYDRTDHVDHITIPMRWALITMLVLVGALVAVLIGLLWP